MAQHCLSGAISLGYSTSASSQIGSSKTHARMAAVSVVTDATHQQTPVPGANVRKWAFGAFLRPDMSRFKGASRFLPSLLAASPRNVPWLHLKAFRPGPPLKALNVRSSRLPSKKVRQEDAPSGDDIPAVELDSNSAEISAVPNTKVSSDTSHEKVAAGSLDGMSTTKAATRKSGVASPSPSSQTKQSNEPTSPRRRSRKSRQDNGGATHATKMFYVKDHKGDIDYLGESTKGDLNVRHDMTDALGAFFTPSGSQLGWPLSLRDSEEARTTFGDPIEEVARAEVKEAEALLEELDIRMRFPQGIAPRGIFCSRTLSLRSITTIGYDMDYTLIHYNVAAWEGRAYDYGMDNLRNMGYPVDGLKFESELVIRGLVVDKEKGNLVKADRFGYVKRAMHGTKMLSNRAISELYGRELVDLRNEDRWVFLNTLFSVSEAVMYMQMVERLDEGALPPELGSLDYQGLYKVVARALFRAHVEGKLKEEIINEPERFVEPDPELPLTLLDQKEAGKRLILITNSDYHYTNKMMQFAFNQYLPDGMDWRALFDMVIVSARKPEFFQRFHPLYEVVTDDGLMRLCDTASPGGLYCGGSAQMVEKALGFHGDETLYVGDHIYTDVSQSKLHLRWRTALICRELEKEVEALAHGRDSRAKLIQLMNQKEVVGDLFNQFRLALQRRTLGHSAQTVQATEMDEREIGESMQKLLVIMRRLDQKIAPMLEADGSFFNERWGYLSRAGLWDKSHLTRQIEKYADIYTSRVSNFLRYTPFMYFRSQSQTLAHDCQNGPETRTSEQLRHFACGYQADMPRNGEPKSQGT